MRRINKHVDFFCQQHKRLGCLKPGSILEIMDIDTKVIILSRQRRPDTDQTAC